MKIVMFQEFCNLKIFLYFSISVTYFYNIIFMAFLIRI